MKRTVSHKMDLRAERVEPQFNMASTGDDFVAAFRARPQGVSNASVGDIAKDFRSDFQAAFKDAADGGKLRGQGGGLLLKYSYYDTKKDSWGAVITTDKAPWDNLVTQGGNYSRVPNEEERTINMALRDGMMDEIPTKVHYISLGPGENTSFRTKDCKILSSLTATSHEISGATTVDIHDRYAKDAAAIIYDKYNCSATALKRDFIGHGLPNITIDDDATPVIAIFGGTLQNMPKGQGETASKNLEVFFTNMTKAMPNAHVIMTVDTTPDGINPAQAISTYSYSLEIELFALNFMARAKEQGIITDQNYDILKHWKITEPEWDENSVNLYIEAKRDHTLHTVDGDYEIAAGDRVSVSRSKKGPIQEHVAILENAGFKNVKTYPLNYGNGHNEPANYVIHAQP
jgi:uncharacterized SAM-dependent methyltransferase